jgi:two-component system response regulator HydG
VALVLPPLRERDGDIELLAEPFLARLATGYGHPIPPLSPEVRSTLRTRRWPGNVRELRNAIERALVLSPAGMLMAEELQQDVDTQPSAAGGLPFPTDLATLNRAAAGRMVELMGGNKTHAARRLGISRPRLLRLLAENEP